MPRRIKALGIGRDKLAGTDKRRFFVMFDDRPAALCDVMRGVRRLAVEFQMPELERDFLLTAGTGNVPELARSGLEQIIDARVAEQRRRRQNKQTPIAGRMKGNKPRLEQIERIAFVAEIISPGVDLVRKPDLERARAQIGRRIAVNQRQRAAWVTLCPLARAAAARRLWKHFRAQRRRLRDRRCKL